MIQTRNNRSAGFQPAALLVLLLLLLTACARTPDAGELHVAAASNLSTMFRDIARACEKSTGVKLVPSFGATAQLEQQIENGGPFDLFLAADTEHVDALIAKNLAVANTRAIYARGTLVIWAPRRPTIKTIEDLNRPDVKAIGIAKPELAPYGRAAVEALTAAHLWPAIEHKAVYAQNIQAVKQFADSSNVDAAFTALALVKDSGGHYVTIDEKLHQPIDQALCIVSATQHPDAAKKVREFLLSAEGRAVFERSGYATIGAQ